MRVRPNLLTVLGLLLGTALLSGCDLLGRGDRTPPYPTGDAPLLYYPQEPSLCPEGVAVYNSPFGQSQPYKVSKTPYPPEPPESGGVVPKPPEGVDFIWNPIYIPPGFPYEHYRIYFLCLGQGWQRTLEGPKWPPRLSEWNDRINERLAKFLILVEDPNAETYLRWYTAYVEW